MNGLGSTEGAKKTNPFHSLGRAGVGTANRSRFTGHGHGSTVGAKKKQSADDATLEDC